MKMRYVSKLIIITPFFYIPFKIENKTLIGQFNFIQIVSPQVKRLARGKGQEKKKINIKITDLEIRLSGKYEKKITNIIDKIVTIENIHNLQIKEKLKIK